MFPMKRVLEKITQKSVKEYQRRLMSMIMMNHPRKETLKETEHKNRWPSGHFCGEQNFKKDKNSREKLVRAGTVQLSQCMMLKPDGKMSRNTRNNENGKFDKISPSVWRYVRSHFGKSDGFDEILPDVKMWANHQKRWVQWKWQIWQKW